MRPARPLNYSVAARQVVPHFLGEHDHPWLRVLLEEHERFIGRPRRELEARLRQPLPCETPPRKLDLASQVLDRIQGRRPRAAVPPRQARALVFVEAARMPAPPETVLRRVATSLGVTEADLNDALFADLPSERLVGAPSKPLSAAELALRSNLASPWCRRCSSVPPR